MRRKIRMFDRLVCQGGVVRYDMVRMLVAVLLTGVPMDALHAQGAQPRISSRNTHGGALRENTVKNGSEVASVMITATRGRLWSNVKQGLLVEFKLSPEAALAAVIPRTQSEVYSLMEMFGVSVGAGLPTDSFKNTSQKTEGTSLSPDGELVLTGSETRTENRTYESGSTEVKAPERAYTNKAGKTFLPAAITAAGGEDQLLRYQAATALFQSVKLLERTIEDAVAINNYKAHIATLRLTVMPYARNMPYDMYTTISFSTDKATSSSVRVIPLLITDQLEASSQMRESSRMIEAALSIAGAMYGVSANAKADWLRQQISALSGRDLNSLLTIGCPSEDTLEIRVGAMLQGSSKLGLVSKSIDVSFLVLTDPGKQTKQISFDATTRFRDTQTGRLLPTSSYAALTGASARLMGEIGSVKWYKNNGFLSMIAGDSIESIIKGERNSFFARIEAEQAATTPENVYKSEILNNLIARKEFLWTSLAPVQEQAMIKVGEVELEQAVGSQERVQAVISLVPMLSTTLTGKTTEILQFAIKNDTVEKKNKGKNSIAFSDVTVSELWLGGRKADKLVVTDATITAFFSGGTWHPNREIATTEYEKKIEEYNAFLVAQEFPPIGPPRNGNTGSPKAAIAANIAHAIQFPYPASEYLQFSSQSAVVIAEDLEDRGEKTAARKLAEPLLWNDEEIGVILKSAEQIKGEFGHSSVMETKPDIKKVAFPALVTTSHGVLQDPDCVIEIKQNAPQPEKKMAHVIRVNESNGSRTLEFEEKGSLTGPQLIDAAKEILAPPSKED